MQKMSKIELLTRDGELFVIDEQLARHSEVLNNMMKAGSMANGEVGVVPLEAVSAAVLRLVVIWLDHHKHDAAELAVNNPDDCFMEWNDEEGNQNPPYHPAANAAAAADVEISGWDAAFLSSFDQGTLFLLATAAKLLEIEGLLRVILRSIANMMKGKSPQDIRYTFGIENDLTSAEEELIRQQNNWELERTAPQ